MVEQQRQVFNETVGNLEQSVGGHHTAAHLKDLVVKNLCKNGGVSYSEASELVAAWAGTSSDSQIRSIAMQEAASEVPNHVHVALEFESNSARTRRSSETT